MLIVTPTKGVGPAALYSTIIHTSPPVPIPSTPLRGSYAAYSPVALPSTPIQPPVSAPAPPTTPNTHLFATPQHYPPYPASIPSAWSPLYAQQDVYAPYPATLEAAHPANAVGFQASAPAEPSSSHRDMFSTQLTSDNYLEMSSRRGRGRGRGQARCAGRGR